MSSRPDQPTSSTQHPDSPETQRGARPRYRRVFVGGIAIVAMGLAAIPVWARARFGGHGHGWHEDGEFVEFLVEHKLRRIGASEEQREKILSIVAETRETLIALGDEHPTAHDDFIEQLVLDPGDRDRLDALRAAQLDRIERGSGILLDGVSRIGEILTPEQRAQVAEMTEAHRERWKH